jgi:hypothetical protein
LAIVFVCYSVLFVLAIVLSVHLFVLYWPLCCLSCSFCIGHCVVCPSIIFALAIVLSAFLRFPDSDYLIGIVNLLL